ncbi:RecX family transcriptional regulator [Anaerofustis sp.]|uniref:RecX family transcriptional regulator n=1 Tax=Anaerofustis sp. TaxID=1872517 RepID=UPI0025BC2917|nr:RecX family transcriptional regulator [Anaerofustis sp.]
MDIITKITKSKREYSVTLNDEIVLRLDKKVLDKLSLFEEVDREELVKESYDYLYDKGLNLALNYLSYAARCENEVVEYLSKKHFPDIVVNDILNRLLELKDVNDEDYIESYVSSKSCALIGRNKMKNDLIKKGIDIEKISKVLERCFSEEEERDNLIKFIKKNNLKHKDLFYREKKEKTANAAVRKGYDYRLINSLIDDYLTEEENLIENEKVRENIRKKFFKYLDKGEDLIETKYKVYSFFMRKGYNEEVLNSVYEEILNDMLDEQE